MSEAMIQVWVKWQVKILMRVIALTMKVRVNYW